MVDGVGARIRGGQIELVGRTFGNRVRAAERQRRRNVEDADVKVSGTRPVVIIGHGTGVG